MKNLLIIITISICCFAETPQKNPYENYDRKPINWLVFNIIGGSIFTTAFMDPNMNTDTRMNLMQSGALVFNITAPIFIVKYIKHYKYLEWIEKNQSNIPETNEITKKDNHESKFTRSLSN